MQLSVCRAKKSLNRIGRGWHDGKHLCSGKSNQNEIVVHFVVRFMRIFFEGWLQGLCLMRVIELEENKVCRQEVYMINIKNF